MTKKKFEVRVLSKLDEIWLVDAEDESAARDFFGLGEKISSYEFDHEVHHVVSAGVDQ